MTSSRRNKKRKLKKEIITLLGATPTKKQLRTYKDTGEVKTATDRVIFSTFTPLTNQDKSDKDYLKARAELDKFREQEGIIDVIEEPELDVKILTNDMLVFITGLGPEVDKLTQNELIEKWYASHTESPFLPEDSEDPPTLWERIKRLFT